MKEPALYGYDLFGKKIKPASNRGVMATKFYMPPFSVLNARDGHWQSRKQAWIRFGIKGEQGRVAATWTGSRNDTRTGREGGKYKGGHAWLNGRKLDGSLGFSEAAVKFGYTHDKDGKPKRKKAIGQPFTGGMAGEVGVPGGLSARYSNKKGKTHGTLRISESSMRLAGGYENPDGTMKDGAGTSVFDPVLCELAYRWFCPTNGHILDPFAGGSPRGIVASALGYEYTGCELRQEQVDANRRQAEITKTSPNWILGDSSNIDQLLQPNQRFDFVWTCPPYFDLEVYSGDTEKDGSAFETYDKFIVWYQDIFRQCVRRLRKNRFLAVTVGEIRDERGIYRNFVGDNVKCFTDLGLHYYNEIILVTAIGSLPIRAGKVFSASRKIGKTHQNVLVFWKGDPKRIKETVAELFR